MPIGTVTKRFNNEKNIKVTMDNGGKDKSYSTNKRELYPILEEGNTVNYTLQQNGDYWNIVSATLEKGAAPAAAQSRAHQSGAG